MTGSVRAAQGMFDDVQDGWRHALASGDVEKYKKFLKDMKLNESDNPLEAIALEHGFIPEGDGIAAVDLERRITSSLPHIAYIAYMVSGPRQEPIWVRLCSQGMMLLLDLIGLEIGNKVSVGLLRSTSMSQMMKSKGCIPWPM